MQVRLEYGKQGLEVDLPDKNVVGVLKLAPAPPLPDPVRATIDALAAPIGTRSLKEIARDRRDVCIVVCDITRPVPNALLLPPILEQLQEVGIPNDRIKILIATGTHRPNSGAEFEAIVGKEVASKCEIINHICTDKDAHTSFGRTPAGTPAALDKNYCDADFKLSVGLIEPHFMAGYSGGRKLIMPGIAAQETIHYWHSPRFLEHPKATSGVVEGNPVHEEALAIARMCPPDLIVDVTLDETNQITGVFAGDLEKAWAAGVAFARQHVHVPVPASADIVVTTCAGYPLDATFYQAVKGMVGALPIVKPGGSIIVAASCSEGIGGEVFTRTLIESRDLGAFMDQIQQPGWTVVADQWQIEELARVVCRHTVYCVCEGIPAEKLAQL
ncbi:MAG TPA: nickel-dependent lactate racemase, partial [Capsulimonadaceae bacterium]|nr:nickel-dependent lactate racemase [Capsulimonadaceae bacterium]